MHSRRALRCRLDAPRRSCEPVWAKPATPMSRAQACTFCTAFEWANGWCWRVGNASVVSTCRLREEQHHSCPDSCPSSFPRVRVRRLEGRRGRLEGSESGLLTAVPLYPARCIQLAKGPLPRQRQRLLLRPRPLHLRNCSVTDLVVREICWSLRQPLLMFAPSANRG